jgi:hypothetical protein
MFARLSRTRKTDRGGRIPAVYRYIGLYFIVCLVITIFFPLAALGIYCFNLPTSGWMAYGAAAMVFAASFFVGCLLGFLFGIPRALSGDAEKGSGEQHSRLTTNTNLEQVSDWLTKIIVGATLVQLGPLTRRFGELATSVSGIFGNPTAQNKTMAGAIILYAAALGFFAAYISARSIITFVFYLSPSDWFPEQQHMPTKQGADGVDESQADTKSPISGISGQTSSTAALSATAETTPCRLSLVSRFTSSLMRRRHHQNNSQQATLALTLKRQNPVQQKREEL